jgi:hypothetical protein
MAASARCFGFLNRRAVRGGPRRERQAVRVESAVHGRPGPATLLWASVRECRPSATSCHRWRKRRARTHSRVARAVIDRHRLAHERLIAHRADDLASRQRRRVLQLPRSALCPLAWRSKPGSPSFRLFSTEATSHHALIPQKAAGSSRPRPVIPAKQRARRPAHVANPRPIPPSQ